jgi:hypothetical protein
LDNLGRAGGGDSFGGDHSAAAAGTFLTADFPKTPK